MNDTSNPTWTSDELDDIEAAQELRIAPRRRNGELRKPVPIWVVRVGGDVYIRAAYGPETGWHRVARASGVGHISAGGVEKDVTLEHVDDVNDEVDAAYRTKYARHAGPVLNSVIDANARASTLRVVPRA
jgi:hypothetical protein